MLVIQRIWRGFLGRLLAWFRWQEVQATLKTAHMLAGAHLSSTVMRIAMAVPIQTRAR